MKNLEFLKTIPDNLGMSHIANLFLFKGRLCATDAVIMFICDIPDGYNVDELIDLTNRIEPTYKPPQEGFVNYSIETIRNEISKFPLVDEYEYEDCPECDGIGSVEYTYESKSGSEHTIDHDCPVCDGDGNIAKKTGKKIPDVVGCSFEFNGTHFNPLKLMPILNTPDCPDVFSVAVTKDRMYFRIGEFEGVLMGINGNDGNSINIEPLS